MWYWARSCNRRYDTRWLAPGTCRCSRPATIRNAASVRPAAADRFAVQAGSPGWSASFGSSRRSSHRSQPKLGIRGVIETQIDTPEPDQPEVTRPDVEDHDNARAACRIRRCGVGNVGIEVGGSPAHLGSEGGQLRGGGIDRHQIGELAEERLRICAALRTVDRIAIVDGIVVEAGPKTRNERRLEFLADRSAFRLLRGQAADGAAQQYHSVIGLPGDQCRIEHRCVRESGARIGENRRLHQRCRGQRAELVGGTSAAKLLP